MKKLEKNEAHVGKAARAFSITEKGKTAFAYINKLPFAPGSEAWSQRLKEAKAKNEQLKEVNCTGTTKFEIVGRKLTLRIYNEKIQHWQEVIGVEYEDVCPVCGILMLVRAVQGSTWLALCSKECYEKYDALKKEVKPLRTRAQISLHFPFFSNGVNEWQNLQE